MFKKLLSNLPFNPSLISQVAFYGRRMHKEEKLRRTGAVLVVLAIAVQMLAIVSPPEHSFAGAGNDIIPGGFTTQAQAVGHCNANNYEFRTTLEHFGINCANLNGAAVKDIRSTDHNRKLISIGRLPYGKAGERTVVIGGKTYYQRYLWSWDSGPFSTYKALVGTRSDGTPYMVLFNCGNITVVETTPAPPPPPAPPVIQSKCNYANAAKTVKPNETFYVGFNATNGSGETWTPEGPWKIGSAEPENNTKLTITRAPVRAGTTIPSGSNGVFESSSFKAPLAPGNYTYVWQLLKEGSVWFPGTNCTFSITVLEPSKPAPPPTTPEPTPTPTPEKPCEESQNEEDTYACLVLSKSAQNYTQNIDDANNTTAAAGDKIIYTLRVKNNGKTTAKDFVVEENLTDVLEYADVVDLNGGEIDDQKVVRWAKADIKAGVILTKHITVKIKNPIPQTPSPASNPGSFDLMMTNVYGNAVNIKLPGSVAKIVETTTTTLPNTGPGEVLAVSITLTVVVSYFFARSRLLGKELDLVRAEYSTSGGL